MKRNSLAGAFYLNRNTPIKAEQQKCDSECNQLRATTVKWKTFQELQNGNIFQPRILEWTITSVLQAALSLRVFLPVAWSWKRRQDLSVKKRIFIHSSRWHLHSIPGTFEYLRPHLYILGNINNLKLYIKEPHLSSYHSFIDHHYARFLFCLDEVFG